MRPVLIHILAVVILLLNQPGLFAQSTVFTHEGRLSEDGAPATRSYDSRFALCDSWSGGQVIPAPLGGVRRSGQFGSYTGRLASADGSPIFAPQLLLRAVEISHATTNFSAAVDVDTVDRRSNPRQSSHAKEAWKFYRAGATNTFTRTRFTPVTGREFVESTNYTGGRMVVGESSTSLPSEASLPGFELMNLLNDMLAAGPVVERREGESLILSANVKDGTTLRAWFDSTRVMPVRLEKRMGATLAFVLARTEAGADARLLPLHDSLHFYDNGRVTMTVLRTFSKVEELPMRSQGKPSQHQ